MQLISEIVITRTEQLLQEMSILKTQLGDLKKTNQLLLERVPSNNRDESQVSVILDQRFHSINLEGDNNIDGEMPLCTGTLLLKTYHLLPQIQIRASR